MASAAVLRALRELNAALTGHAGYSCPAPAVIAADIADLRPFYPDDPIYDISPANPWRGRELVRGLS